MGYSRSQGEPRCSSCASTAPGALQRGDSLAHVSGTAGFSPRVSLEWAPWPWAAPQGWRCLCSAAPGPSPCTGGLTWPLPCTQRQPGADPVRSRPAGGLPSPGSGTPWLRLRHRPREQRVRTAPASAAPSIPAPPATTTAGSHPGVRPLPFTGVMEEQESRAKIHGENTVPPRSPRSPQGMCCVLVPSAHTACARCHRAALRRRPPSAPAPPQEHMAPRPQIIASLRANYCN